MYEIVVYLCVRKTDEEKAVRNSDGVCKQFLADRKHLNIQIILSFSLFVHCSEDVRKPSSEWGRNLQ